ncbi:Panacea domain-containing protein [Sorangium sp. So ce1099]|uniref:Panacea domain-containing protein n=1 Tax=Sorangium sp. So ce1099 TaxID=3133331 RepID=UPI003F633EAC
MTSASNLANWIRATIPTDRERLTHLKLQKLIFYCYGAALAFGCEDELGGKIVFEPWDHGPVNREVWYQYRHRKGEPIEPLERHWAPRYSPRVETHLQDIIDVYGGMDAWGLRQETHLEEPWIEAYKSGLEEIPEDALRRHFRDKFNPDGAKAVAYPEYLLNASNFALDRIPVRGCASLHELAHAVKRVQVQSR